MNQESPSLVRQILEEWRSQKSTDFPDEVNTSEFPLTDSEDLEILMHREVHFEGLFDVMIDYYMSDGKGALLDPQRIEDLAELERHVGHNLAKLCLTGSDWEKVQRSRTAYQRLRSLCELQPKATRSRLIADLILSEADEEEAVQAIVKAGPLMIPELVRLLEAEELSESLAPGYGLAPALAARCLGALADPAAIKPLFNSIGHPHEELDSAAISALKAIGPLAQHFLLQQVAAKPITMDTERAAAALSNFPPDPAIAQQALQLLTDPSLYRHANLAAYLAICCAGLRGLEQRQRLSEIAQNPHLPSMAQQELEYWLPRIPTE